MGVLKLRHLNDCDATGKHFDKKKNLESKNKNFYWKTGIKKIFQCSPSFQLHNLNICDVTYKRPLQFHYKIL